MVIMKSLLYDLYDLRGCHHLLRRVLQPAFLASCAACNYKYYCLHLRARRQCKHANGAWGSCTFIFQIMYDMHVLNK